MFKATFGVYYFTSLGVFHIPLLPHKPLIEQRLDSPPPPIIFSYRNHGKAEGYSCWVLVELQLHSLQKSMQSLIKAGKEQRSKEVVAWLKKTLIKVFDTSS